MIFTPTKKTRIQLDEFNNAPILGNPYECFLTGEKVDYRNYRVFSINTPNGRKKYKIYLNSMYHTMCRASIPFIEQKILNEAKKY